MIKEHSSFPIQKLPLREKTKAWKEACVDGIVGREDSNNYGGKGRKETMMTCYGLYNSEYDENDLKYVTDPFNVADGFPARIQNFNIIRPKIDLLIGEESKRPMNIKVIQTNYDAVSKLQDTKKQLLLDYMMKYIGQSTDENGQPMTPPEIEKYMRKNYKSVAEQSAFHAIRYFKEKLNLNNEFLKGWKDALLSSEELYYVGEINGNPFVEQVNPVFCDYDMDPDLEFIEDGDWFLRRMDMSPAILYDRYYNLLKEKDLDAILSYVSEATSNVTKYGDGGNTIMWKEKFSNKIFDSEYSTSDGNTIPVYHAVWRSYKRVGFVTTVDPETGEETENMVSEDYKPIAGEAIRWEWLPEIWEGYKAGDDVYFGIGPVEYQHVSIDNPTNRKLPYCGAIYSNTNSKAKSLAQIMKPIQYMYIVLWYRLEVALARDKGKILTMDITQIPKGLGISVEQWMHYLGSLGVNFINPHDNGWDIVGREGGRASAYNQITSTDLTMSNVLAEYVQLMMKLEEMLGDICGVTKQRQGSIAQRELVGNVERSVIQSSHTTEPLFWKHNQVKRNVLNMLLDVVKHVASKKEKMALHYVFSDGERIFMELNDDLVYADLDVFCSDSTQESQNIDALKSLLQPAMSAGASLGEAAEVITGENISLIKEKLLEIDARRQANEQAASQQDQELMAAQLKLKQEELRIKEEDSIRQSATDLQVAAMSSANNNGEQTDPNDAELAMKKVQSAIDKANGELKIKEAALRESVRKNKRAEQQKDEELAIRRKQASRPTTTTKK